MNGLPGVEADLSSLLRNPELDLEVRLCLETRLEGIRRAEGLLREEKRRREKGHQETEDRGPRTED
jgi:hypothetical protein